MAIKEKKSPRFARSQRLHECYQMIGLSLLEYEKTHTGLGSVIDLSHYNTPFPIPIDFKSFFNKSLINFEQGVSFVPLEILSSYLEDLLDLDVSEEDLYITLQKKFFGTIWIALIGLCLSLGAGLYVVSLGVSLAYSFALTVLLALPFGLLWHYAPRDKHSRRIRFAKLLQNEISRRKGDMGPFVTTALQGGSGIAVAGKMFGKASIGSTRGAMREGTVIKIH